MTKTELRWKCCAVQLGDDMLARVLLLRYYPEERFPETASTDECVSFFQEMSEQGHVWAARKLWHSWPSASRLSAPKTSISNYSTAPQSLATSSWNTRYGTTWIPSRQTGP